MASENVCPWCGDVDEEPLPEEPFFTECLACGGWFYTRNARVDFEATRMIADAAPIESA